MARDLYEILGVSKTATSEEINKVYRKLARQHHPDRNPGDKQAEAKFKEIQNAYEILNDPDKRAKYDQFGHAGLEGGMPGGGGAPGGFNFNFGGPGGTTFQGNPEMAHEIFSRFFGEGADLGGVFGGGGPKTSGRKRSRKQAEPPPQAIEVEASVPFMTAVKGGSITLGVGSNQIEVKVPAGIEDGKKLRVAGQGLGGGDITVKIRVEAHPYFKREGKDITLEVPISVSEAILGGKVEVPTVDGQRVDVKVRPGTSSGTKMRLPGFGIKGGDQYLVFKIVVPKGSPDDKTKKLIEDYAKHSPMDARADVPWK
jgi:curved DNA-binding protein